MLKRTNQAGSSLLVVFLAIAVVVAVGLIGYRVVGNNSSSTETTTQASTQKSQSGSDIKSSADIDKASTQLESTNVDSQVNPDELDSDINAIL